MPRLSTSHKATVGVGGAVIACETKLWWFRPQTSYVIGDFKNILLPAGVQGVSRRPVWARFNLGTHSRHYGTAGFTANILIDEWMRGLRQGVRAPTIVPSVALSAGPGPTGQTSAYLRFRDSLGARVSPLTAAAPTLAAANNGFTWSSLPLTCLDSSVDQLEGLRGMDGALPRVAWTRQLGVTSVVENVATQALGEAATTDFDEPPLASMNAIYHWAQLLAGNEKYPERVFRTDLFEPERWSGLYVQTDGEPVVGVIVANDTAIFGSKYKIYKMTEFDVDDVDREIEKPDVGMISHDANVSVNQRAIIPCTDEVYLYDGGWVPTLRGRQKEWVREYRINRTDFERARGFYNPNRRVYQFGPVRHSEHGTAWVMWTLHLEDVFPDLSTGNFNPRWTIDAMNRETCGSAVWTLPGSSQPEIGHGFQEGFLRSEDITDDDDDADTYEKAMSIEPAFFMPDPGGGPMDGSTFHKVWSYMQVENSAVTPAWVFEARAGGEFARTRLDPDFFDDMLATAVGPFITEVETRHHHVLEQCVGAGLQLKYRVRKPLGVRFNGYGVTWGRGLHTRGFTASDPG